MSTILLTAAIPAAYIVGALWGQLLRGLGRRIANIDKLRERIVDAHIEGFWEGVEFADEKNSNEREKALEVRIARAQALLDTYGDDDDANKEFLVYQVRAALAAAKESA